MLCFLAALLAPLGARASTPVVNGSTAYGDLSPQQCAKGGSLGPAFLAPGLSCSVSPACANVKSVLAAEAKRVERAYADFCREEARDQKEEAGAHCKEQCQDNQAAKDKRLAERVERLKKVVEDARRRVEDARAAAFQEALELAQKLRVVQRGGWSQRLLAFGGKAWELALPNAWAGGVCRVVATGADHSTYSGSGDSCPGGTMPIEGASMNGNGKEAKALDGLSNGGTLNPSDLAGLHPKIREPLEAASYARGSDGMLADRLNELGRQLASLRSHKGVADTRAQQLGSMSRSGFAEQNATFSFGKKTQAKVESAAVGTEQVVAGTVKVERLSFGELSGANSAESTRTQAAESGLPEGRESAASGISKSNEYDLGQGTTAGVAASASPPSEGGKKFLSRADELRARLRSRLGGRGGAGEGEDGRAPASVADEEASRLFDSGENHLAAQPDEKNEVFSMAGSETDAAIKNLLGELQSSPEVLGADSKGLFERVHRAHQSIVRSWK